MYRKWPNNARVVDLILGVQEGDRSNGISVCTAVYSMVSSRFFESEPNEIYSHVSEKGQKAGFLRQKYQESQYRGKRKGEKERARRTKGGEEKNAMVALLGL